LKYNSGSFIFLPLDVTKLFKFVFLVSILKLTDLGHFLLLRTLNHSAGVPALLVPIRLVFIFVGSNIPLIKTLPHLNGDFLK
jgi:hypothetical protein